VRRFAPFLGALALGAVLAAGWGLAAPAAEMPTLAASRAGESAAGSAGACDRPAVATDATAPGGSYADGAVTGTTTADLAAFAERINELRIAACLEPFPADRIVWSACLEERLVWMATDPSTDPASAWGHLGSVRSDGVPSTGCDGNLAGGDGNTGATVAAKWWDSPPHRESLYRPGKDSGTACIAFAMTHGGVPDEPSSFTRAAAIWTDC
jgi:hypothetical protein